MRIQPFSLGTVGTNCYVLYDYDENKALLIDAPDGIERAISFIRSNGLCLEAVLLTHGHFDHVLGLKEVRAAFPTCKIFIDKEDKDYILEKGIWNKQLLSLCFPDLLYDFESDLSSLPENLSFYEDCCFGFEIMRTPGHTPGSVCLYSKTEDLLFSGDTLFMCGWGRTDFPYGNQKELMQSLEMLLHRLEGKTDVLPGHGPSTTIKAEISALGL